MLDTKTLLFSICSSSRVRLLGKHNNCYYYLVRDKTYSLKLIPLHELLPGKA